MVWLATHIWMLLAGAAFIGLLLGLGLRGLLLGGKARRAEVERDVAMTELHQARTEIEGLYSAQRTARTGGHDGGDAGLRDELAAREARMTSLADELARAKDELATLKEAPPAAQTALAGAAGAVAGAAAAAVAGRGDGDAADETRALDAGIDEDEASLSWRNRYLESQVRRLQSELADAQQAAPVEAAADAAADTADTGETAMSMAAAGVAGATAGAAGAAAASVTEIDQTDLAKIRWQNDYLQTRVKVLEGKLSEASAVSAAPLVEDAAPGIIIETDDTPAPSEDGGKEGRAETADEEVARLRWRNRYLEGRLAYLEENASGEGDGGPGPAAALAAGGTALGAAVASGAALAARAVESADETTDDSVAEPEPESEGETLDEDDGENEDAPEAVIEDAEPEAAPQPAEPVEPEPEPAPEPEPETGVEAEPAPVAEAEPDPEPEVEAPELAEDAPVADEAPVVDDADEDAGTETGYTPAFADDAAGAETAEEDTAAAPEPVAVDPVIDELEVDEAPGEPDTVPETEAELAPEAEPAEEDAPEEAAPEPVAAEVGEAPADADGAAPGDTDPAAQAALATVKPDTSQAPRTGGDDLTAIGGIGPRIQDVLNELGVHTYGQIAAWTPENEAWVDEYLSFSGRVGRERWVEQAKVLAEQGAGGDA